MGFKETIAKIYDCSFQKTRQYLQIVSADLHDVRYIYLHINTYGCFNDCRTFSANCFVVRQHFSLISYCFF